jgi:23S rRNA (uracil1939-C5)-methyltransferase
VVDIYDCRLQSPLSNEIVAAVRGYAQERGWVPYHKRTHQGEARHLVVREGKRTGEVLVNVVSRSDALPGVEQLARDLDERFAAVASCYWSISPEKADAIKVHRELLLFGAPRIREVIDGLQFFVGPGTFFQTNTLQAERLCAVVAELREEAEHGPEPVVFDLYCGVGLFALSTARRSPGARVVGVEVVEDSVAAARENAELNALQGVEFVAGYVEQCLPGLVRRVGRPDVVVVDPPRAGLEPGVVRALGDLPARQILYVSCNPVALGRDLAGLCEAGYRVAVVQPIDLFPHTRHVECVVSLVRR